MNDFIPAPTISEILQEEFMIPLNLSAYRLAKDIEVPVSRIQDILHNRRKITVDTALRLSKYFGLSEKYFIDIQNDIDFRNMKQQISDSLFRIVPIAQKQERQVEFV